ncbi:hypothetical protein DVJ78_16240 [Humibacter sp. BT305]|nr:hypothetical protein DVJ78_16240 [Humibacter sp. BT305]
MGAAGSSSGYSDEELQSLWETVNKWGYGDRFSIGSVNFEILYRYDGEQSTWDNMSEYVDARNRIFDPAHRVDYCFPGPGPQIACALK